MGRRFLQREPGADLIKDCIYEDICSPVSNNKPENAQTANLEDVSNDSVAAIRNVYNIASPQSQQECG